MYDGAGAEFYSEKAPLEPEIPSEQRVVISCIPGNWLCVQLLSAMTT
jgi:hypothetical protein